MTKALPIAVVLTISATGSEMNSGAVISNEETKEKLEINTPLLYPSISVCDPTYLFTLREKRRRAGTRLILFLMCLNNIFSQMTELILRID